MMGKIVIKVINVRLLLESRYIAHLSNTGKTVIFWGLHLKWEGDKMGKRIKKVRRTFERLATWWWVGL